MTIVTIVTVIYATAVKSYNTSLGATQGPAEASKQNQKSASS